MKNKSIGNFVLIYIILYSFLGALPFIQATFPGDNMFIPVLYDSPSCGDPATYSSILECPRTGVLCNDTNDRARSSNSSSATASGGADMAGLLGRLTRAGRRDGIGFAGVTCAGKIMIDCEEPAQEYFIGIKKKNSYLAIDNRTQQHREKKNTLSNHVVRVVTHVQ